MLLCEKGREEGRKEGKKLFFFSLPFLSNALEVLASSLFLGCEYTRIFLMIMYFMFLFHRCRALLVLSF